MPLIQSIFCLHGYDERSRFFALSGISTLVFIIFSALFSSYFIVNILLIVLLTSILTLTTIRRLRDAKLKRNWQLVPGILFLITAIITLLLNNNTSYYLLLLPSLISALLLTYPSNNNNKKSDYIYGYYGPVDLSGYEQSTQNTIMHNQRIEPTLVGAGLETQFTSPTVIATKIDQSSANQKTRKIPNQEQSDIGELIRIQLTNNKKLQLGLTISLSIILLSVIIASVLTDGMENKQTQQVAGKSNTKQQDQLKQQPNINTSALITTKEQFLAMPDNFDLYLTPYQGLLLHWQADEVENGKIWSQLTAKGDKSCQVVNFNKGNGFRPLSVEVSNNIDYFASFSPLDTKALVQALAFQSSYSLCGYKFSLKGSQAALGKHNSYADFL